MLNTDTQDQRANLERLCGTYDVLLSAPEAELPREAEDELLAMAKIFDLDTDNPPAQIWTRLRSVLIKQLPAEAPATEPMTLLVVEDDPDTAAGLVEALTAAGHGIVGPFHNAESAEAAAAVHQLDAALLDINLSGATTGVDLARKLKSHWGVPIIFLSGDVTSAARNEDLAEAMIIKPYSGRDILGALNRIQSGQGSSAKG